MSGRVLTSALALLGAGPAFVSSLTLANKSQAKEKGPVFGPALLP
jgi:hypothetical protein